MKKITELMGQENVKIGKYYISSCADYPDGTGSVWIEHESGEAGQFPTEKLEPIIEEFYNKYF